MNHTKSKPTYLTLDTANAYADQLRALGYVVGVRKRAEQLKPPFLIVKMKHSDKVEYPGTPYQCEKLIAKIKEV